MRSTNRALGDTRLAAAARAALILLALAACGGGGDGGGTAPSGDFSIAISPAALSVEAGSSGSFTVSISRSGSFTGPVTLRLDGPPAGVSATFASTSATSSTATLSVAASAATGSYTVTVVGSAAGKADRSASIALTVTRDPGSFSMTATPASLTVVQGRSGSTTIAIARVAPFTGPVSVILFMAPPGVTGTATPASVASDGTTATLTLDVAASVAPGDYPLLVLGRATGVGDQSVPVTLTVAPDPGGFTMAVSPTALSVEQRLAGSATLTLTRIAPFTGPVSLSAEGAPVGVSATFAPATLAAGTTTSTLTVSVGAAVPPGSYPITIRGSATGLPVATATLTLTVTPSPGGFTITATPTSIMRGRVGTVAVTIERLAPFTGAVALTLDDVPIGLAGTLTPASIPAGATTAELTVSVLAMVPPANYPITIRGTATGVPAQTATQMVTVTQPPPGNVSLQFCNPLMFPIWVGYQNGAEQWTQAAGINGAYEFLISADKGAIGIVTPYGTGTGVGYDITVVFGTRAELIEAGRLTCGRTSQTKSLTGTVIGGATDDAIAVTIGTAGTVNLFQDLGAGYTLSQVEVGTRDLFAAQHRPHGAPGASKVIIRRGIDYAPGSAIPVLDFASAEAQVADRRTLTVANTGGEDWWLQEAYITAGATVGFFPDQLVFGATTRDYFVVPPSLATAGDRYSVEATSISDIGGGVRRTTRSVSRTVTTATDLTLTLGPMLDVPDVLTLQAAPFYQVRLRTRVQPEYANAFYGRYIQPSRLGAVFATTGYTGGPVVDLTTPDLRAVPGWQGLWGPIPGTATELRLWGFGWSGTSGPLFPGWLGQVVTEPGVTLHGAVRYDVTTPAVNPPAGVSRSRAVTRPAPP